jgi:hypothetical protein
MAVWYLQKFQRNAGNRLQDHMAQQHRRVQL